MCGKSTGKATCYDALQPCRSGNKGGYYGKIGFICGGADAADKNGRFIKVQELLKAHEAIKKIFSTKKLTAITIYILYYTLTTTLNPVLGTMTIR